MGSNGKVYAFEPHSAISCGWSRTFLQLSSGGVIPRNLPLYSREGFAYFNHDSTDPGSSNSQLSNSLNETDTRQPAAMAELKYATSIDRLIESGTILLTQHVKIDIDGKELDVLRGMMNFLNPLLRTVQVELNGHGNDEIFGMMKGLGYRLSDKHYSRSATRRLAQTGTEPESGCNAIFLQQLNAPYLPRPMQLFPSPRMIFLNLLETQRSHRHITLNLF
jgi:FkbM family methyltransferase